MFCTILVLCVSVGDKNKNFSFNKVNIYMSTLITHYLIIQNIFSSCFCICVIRFVFSSKCIWSLFSLCCFLRGLFTRIGLNDKFSLLCHSLDRSYKVFQCQILPLLDFEPVRYSYIHEIYKNECMHKCCFNEKCLWYTEKKHLLNFSLLMYKKITDLKLKPYIVLKVLYESVTVWIDVLPNLYVQTSHHCKKICRQRKLWWTASQYSKHFRDTNTHCIASLPVTSGSIVIMTYCKIFTPTCYLFKKREKHVYFPVAIS